MNFRPATLFATNFAHSLSGGGKVDDDFTAISRVPSLKPQSRAGA